ncbi:unnamed protein product [Vitrella brassicaformis CCMP3155]|uniref:Rad60/SUMO-like domain-containing protein n=1 Tax=Vitrella brassicaformis (strain CCMP3155) TaxID=1169540 RepID=A0A0G4F9N1_VITBC|nr:unnamed protein product [Vitrella brassicaformis CCMP3155]|eukprot:CEM09671.1 unnamed protein product [Vitrella brassicaformis CCMP3155]
MEERATRFGWASAAVFLFTAVFIHNRYHHLPWHFSHQQDDGFVDSVSHSNATWTCGEDRSAADRNRSGLAGLLRVPRCSVYHVFDPRSSSWVATAANSAANRCSMKCPLHHHCNVDGSDVAVEYGGEWPYLAVDDCHLAPAMSSLRCGAFSLFGPRFSHEKKKPFFFRAGTTSWDPRTDLRPDLFLKATRLPMDPSLELPEDLTLQGHLKGVVQTQAGLLKLIQGHPLASRGFLLHVPRPLVDIFFTNSTLHPLQKDFDDTFARLWRQTYGEPHPKEVKDALVELGDEWLSLAERIFIAHTKSAFSDMNKDLASDGGAEEHRTIASIFRLLFRSDLGRLDAIVPPRQEGRVYRIATARSSSVEGTYKVGVSVSWPSFASTSLSKSFARAWGGGYHLESLGRLGIEIRHGIDPESEQSGFMFDIPWGVVHKNAFFSILLRRCRLHFHPFESVYTRFDIELETDCIKAQYGVSRRVEMAKVPVKLTHTPLSIELAGGVMMRMIDRFAAVPVRNSTVLTTTRDNQSSVTIQVYEGESVKAKDNTLAGVLVLSDIQLLPAGVPQIMVLFDVEPDGILTVSAQEMGTGTRNDIMIAREDHPMVVKVDTNGKKASVGIRSWQSFGSLLDTYHTKMGLSPNTYTFVYNGRRISRHDTPHLLGIKEGDIILAMPSEAALIGPRNRVSITTSEIGLWERWRSFTVVVPKGTYISTVKIYSTKTSEYGQDTFHFKVFECKHCCMQAGPNLLQRDVLNLEDLTPAPKGAADILVTFSIAEDGIITVSAEEKGTANRANITMPQLAMTQLSHVSPPHIKVMCGDEGKELYFTAGRKWTKRMSYLIYAWQKEFRSNPNTYRFFYRGEPVYGDDTTDSLGVMDGDIIEAVPEDRPARIRGNTAPFQRGASGPLIVTTQFDLAIDGGASMEAFIHRDTALPANRSMIYTTTNDKQTDVPFDVYEGDGSLPLNQSYLLGQVSLSDVSPAPKGVPKIQVTFAVDISGILTVSLADLATVAFVSGRWRLCELGCRSD